MKTILFSFFFLVFFFPGHSQRIFYSDIERDDYRQMNFEIIGKVGGNINVYKNFKNKNDISVYDNEMKLINKVRLEMLPDKISNVDFVVYQDSYHMVYQYQKKSVIYCATIRLNGEGKLMSDPLVLDTTHIEGNDEIKVYTLIYSEDKQKIMIFKINGKNDRYNVFSTLLFDKNLVLQKKSVMTSPMSGKEGVFNDFILDNEGDLAFGRSNHVGSQNFISEFNLFIKKADEDTLQITEIPLTNYMLDEVKIKADNNNKRFLLTSFYYEKNKSNIDGLITLIWDKNAGYQQAVYRFKFNDTLRMDARSENSSAKTAFNDYFIKNLIPTKDGGFAVVAELFYTNSRSSGWNRWDYLYGGGGGISPMDYSYNSPYSGSNQWRYADPWNRWGSNNMVRYYSENVMIFFFNKDGGLQWSNTIQKQQFDDNSEMYLSYQLFNTGNEVRFLFNQLERRELMLNSVTINASGVLKRDPTLKGLDQAYEFMPRYGKQIGLRQIVLPCMNRNFICFAKLEF